MKKKIKKYKFSEFKKDIKLLAKKLKETKIEFKNVYGFPRGGLIGAVYLSYLLNLHLVTKIGYINKKTTIIFDEVIDKGYTLTGFEDYYTCCIHLKPHSKFKPNIYLHKVKNDTYVSYFWEGKE